MNQTNSKSDTYFDVDRERQALGQALLGATSTISMSMDPRNLLCSLCDSFVTSSDHIQMAWMVLGNLDEGMQPHYITGKSAYQFKDIPLDIHRRDCPYNLTRLHWQATTADIRACHEGGVGRMELASMMTLPIGKQASDHNGIVCLYADIPDYFDLVGQDLFLAFTHLANASLEQSVLLANLAHLASHDQLTGVLNRRGLQEFLDKEYARARRHEKSFGLILFDIDRFKLINDGLGHQEGDVVLQTIANHVASMLRSEDSFGRWGGEEFLCIIPEGDRQHVLELSERLRTTLSKLEISSANKGLRVTASFGVSVFPEDGDTTSKLIASADSALYQAKRAGRNRTFSADTVRQHVYSQGSMLESALREDRIIPAYQPIVDLATGEIVAEETLARLVTSTGDILSAAEFIGAASQLQMLHKIDRIIMMKAFSHCVAGLQSGRGRLNHFVNVSADLLRHQDLVMEMLAAARIHCSDCAGLIGDVKPMIIEITERELLEDIDNAKELLMPFIDFGLRLALDDFGSGYSSYKYLADLPVSFLKIDGELIRRVREPKVRAIVQGIQDTASQLSITTLAEFVEDGETESILKDIGIDWVQGYYYGRPVVSPWENPALQKLNQHSKS